MTINTTDEPVTALPMFIPTAALSLLHLPASTSCRSQSCITVSEGSLELQQCQDIINRLASHAGAFAQTTR